MKNKRSSKISWRLEQAFKDAWMGLRSTCERMQDWQQAGEG